MGKANDCRSNVLQEAIQIAGLGADQMPDVIETLGATQEGVNSLTIEKLRLLLLNALEALNNEFSNSEIASETFGKIEFDTDGPHSDSKNKGSNKNLTFKQFSH